MPQIEGSLSRRVLDIVRFGNGKVAGMVIDEQGASHGKTNEQMIMLRKLAVWRCPIFLVELRTWVGQQTSSHEAGTAVGDDTLKEFSPLRTKRAPPERPPVDQTARRLECRRVTKRFFNALVQTDLMKKLQADDITHVVIMGQQTNCCVRATAIGGKDIDRGPAYAGLVQHGIVCSARPS